MSYYYGTSNDGFNTTTKLPPYSVDLVIDRVHIVAGNINEMTHVVEDNGKLLADRGDSVAKNLNTNFGGVSENVARMINLAREKFYGIPVDVFYTVLICALILIILAMIFLIIFGVQKYTVKRYKTLTQRQVGTDTASYL